MVDVVVFIVMLAVYTAVMIYIGYRGYKATKNVQDWLVAGRRVGPLVVAMSYGAKFLAPFAAALYWKRATTLGVIASMVGGLAATLLWYMFVYSKTAPKITGVNVAAPLCLLDPLFVAIPLSFILLIVVSLMTKQPEEEQIARAFTGIS